MLAGTRDLCLGLSILRSTVVVAFARAGGQRPSENSVNITKDTNLSSSLSNITVLERIKNFLEGGGVQGLGSCSSHYWLY